MRLWHWAAGSFLATAFVLGCVGDDSNAPPDGGGNDATTDGSAPVESGSEAAVDAPADAPAAFTPASFGTDLALWLVGDNASNTAGAVDTWYDQSTYKTNLVQAGASSRPLYEQAVLNGHSVLDFNGNGFQLYVAPDPDAGTTPPNLSFGQTDDFVIAAVVSESPTMPAGYIFAKTQFKCTGGCAPGDGLVFDINQDEAAVRESSADSFLTTTGGTFSDHAYHVVAVRRIGETTMQLRVDTVTKNATITGFDVSEPQFGLMIGLAGGTFNGTFAFRMAELVAVHRTTGAINDAEVSNIEAYLKAKYKTP
ncbi:MAG TPA: hypothetical protein VGH28_17210 [Polyangiaceae bacterium]|jgi:hypothetical protein